MNNQTNSKTTNWIIGNISTSKGEIPVISTTLQSKDIFETIKVRFGIGRMNYRISPGLYAVGHPDNSSQVLVSANYKLTFDTLRKELNGLNLWLLILDTDGVNVWCSAGKGTFSTAELLKRIALTGLTSIVEHKTLILPQLCASGVNANDVQKRSGFHVIYGPIRAEDIKEFLSSDMKTTEKMRTVRFNMWDRFILTPIEFIQAAKYSIPVFAVLFLINLFAARPIALPDFLAYCAASIAGSILTPVLLPYIPGRSFAVKGWIIGLLVTAGICFANGWFTSPNLLLGIGYMLALPAYSAFLAMNFTGSSTYTSHTGVTKEIKAALPFILLALIGGCILILIKTFMG